jgi:hypothetical protein
MLPRQIRASIFLGFITHQFPQAKQVFNRSRRNEPEKIPARGQIRQRWLPGWCNRHCEIVCVREGLWVSMRSDRRLNPFSSLRYHQQAALSLVPSIFMSADFSTTTREEYGFDLKELRTGLIRGFLDGLSLKTFGVRYQNTGGLDDIKPCGSGAEATTNICLVLLGIGDSIAPVVAEATFLPLMFRKTPGRARYAQA